MPRMLPDLEPRTTPRTSGRRVSPYTAVIGGALVALLVGLAALVALSTAPDPVEPPRVGAAPVAIVVMTPTAAPTPEALLRQAAWRPSSSSAPTAAVPTPAPLP